MQLFRLVIRFIPFPFRESHLEPITLNAFAWASETLKVVELVLLRVFIVSDYEGRVNI